MKNTAKNENIFEVTMAQEHLGQSVQQYLQTYGYFKNEGDYFELRNVEVIGDKVKLSGAILND